MNVSLIIMRTDGTRAAVSANGSREISKSGDRKHELGTVRRHAAHTDSGMGCGTITMVEQGQARLEGEVEKRLHRCLGAGW